MRLKRILSVKHHGASKQSLAEETCVVPSSRCQHPLTFALGGLVFITSSHSWRHTGCVERPGEGKSSTGYVHPNSPSAAWPPSAPHGAPGQVRSSPGGQGAAWGAQTQRQTDSALRQGADPHLSRDVTLKTSTFCWFSKGGEFRPGVHCCVNLPGFGRGLEGLGAGRYPPRCGGLTRLPQARLPQERLIPRAQAPLSIWVPPVSPPQAGASPRCVGGFVHPHFGGSSLPPGGTPKALSPFPPVSPALRAAASARSRWKTLRSGRSPRRRCPGSAAESQRETWRRVRAQPRPSAPRRPRLTPDVPLQGAHAAAHRGRAQREQAARLLRRHRPPGAAATLGRDTPRLRAAAIVGGGKSGRPCWGGRVERRPLPRRRTKSW